MEDGGKSAEDSVGTLAIEGSLKGISGGLSFTEYGIGGCVLIMNAYPSMENATLYLQSGGTRVSNDAWFFANTEFYQEMSHTANNSNGKE